MHFIPSNPTIFFFAIFFWFRPKLTIKKFLKKLIFTWNFAIFFLFCCEKFLAHSIMSFSNPNPNIFDEIFDSQPLSNNPSSSKQDRWDKLQQKCWQTLSTITSLISQVKEMISKIGSFEDTLNFRSKMYAYRVFILEH